MSIKEKTQVKFNLNTNQVMLPKNNYNLSQFNLLQNKRDNVDQLYKNI